MNNGFDDEQDVSRGPSEVPRRGTALTPRQSEIYRNLKNIGPEIAAFYLDGIRILANDRLETNAYLLAHIAREIDGGLRDILSRDEDKGSILAQLTKGVLAKLGDSNELKDRKGHIASILEALGIDDVHALLATDDVRALLAVRWIKVATQFHKFAHRRGARKQPRRREEFEPLWREFENVLEDLMENFLNRLFGGI